MTDNRRRAERLIPNAMRLYYPDVIDEVTAELDAAEERGRKSVGLGDFVVNTCDDEVRSPYLWDAYGEWLSCTRREGHDGEHEHSDSGYTWSDR